MRISDWSSDVCSSDLGWRRLTTLAFAAMGLVLIGFSQSSTSIVMTLGLCVLAPVLLTRGAPAPLRLFSYLAGVAGAGIAVRSEEHTSELQSLMRISYAVFCLKKKKKRQIKTTEVINDLPKTL